MSDGLLNSGRAAGWPAPDHDPAGHRTSGEVIDAALRLTVDQMRRPDQPAARPELTGRQQQILDFVRAGITVNGFAPTIREIGGEIGVSSGSTVKHHLDVLAAKGYIRRHGARAIQLLNTT